MQRLVYLLFCLQVFQLFVLLNLLGSNLLFELLVFLLELLILALQRMDFILYVIQDLLIQLDLQLNFIEFGAHFVKLFLSLLDLLIHKAEVVSFHDFLNGDIVV